MSGQRKEMQTVIRAGIFVTLGLILFAVMILLIGQERQLFAPQVSFHAWFENVDGLKKDSPVWLGGLEVGHVTAITFSPDLGDKRISVQMDVAAKYSTRVRSDSVARLASRGVLGDKAVDITLGTSEGTPIARGGEIQSGTSGDISSLLKASGQLIDNVLSVSKDIRKLAGTLAEPKVTQGLSSSVSSLSNILAQIETGDGALHTLIYDAKVGADSKQLMARLSSSAARVDQAVAQVDTLLEQVRDGEGLAHALIYDKRGAQALGELGEASKELASLIHDAKSSPNGAVHQLVYGDANSLFANLGSASKDLKKIMGAIASGTGTLGALVNDPTVYDDLRTVLGNVKRNRVLRALVRYSISNGEDFTQVGKPENGKSPSP
jgi:phospholipid/cholesterol/gamma-HCH transport system substrate-binding protein